ncbi:transglycosylase domain-containing protein [Novosphingobium sediminicola]|uniref:Penicillin-binding protein 1A n=1 Tax=Novosphingobium sediminicola TaxID=563162 RepID=A0A7W6CE73_9SPHN|nr:PBP1A family penicillin-binding protein [Novosphingobium sediminicola]MBB3954899.1 penicillin-binding protein 1A [Novosphingobium sediminicola]
MARQNRRGSGDSERESSTGLRGFLKKVAIWTGAVGLLVLITAFAAVWFEAQQLPDFDTMKTSQNGQTILVRARDGSELFAMGPSYGKWLSYQDIPSEMKAAIVATEDRRFRDHIGIDPIGVLRSFYVRAQKGKWRQGGSTLTQQLARTIFLNNDRTWNRKAREALIALALEFKFSKDEILELYLNKVYFGGGAYGVDAAARKFFGHEGKQLSLGEAAIIAGLVKAPSHYSPTADQQAAIDRAKVVLEVMVDAGAITPAQADGVDLQSVKLAAEASQSTVRYFTDWALPQLDVLLPETRDPNNHDNLEVWTTLDPKLQNAATSAIKGYTPKDAQGALVSMDRDGAVLAMVGGQDYVASNYNRATNALRQPGSAWKLFVYMAALEAGVKPDDPVVDQPVTIDGWSPRNSGGTYAGQIDVRTAFAYSKNTVAAQLGQQVTFDAVAAMARRFGISTPISTNPSMVLGSNDVRVIDMVKAFAAVSARGTSVEPYGIVKVVASDGRVLYEHAQKQGQTLVAPFVSAGITDLLQTAVNIGTGRAAQIGRPVAGKTGTTSSNKDGWFLGFSSGVTTGVWMGRDDAKAVPGLQGGTAPARAFAQYMKVAVAQRPIEPFETQLTLPDWQLEPDDMANLSGPDAYVPTDEGASPDGNNPTDNQPAPAANPDFLDNATGRQGDNNTRKRAQPSVGI